MRKSYKFDNVVFWYDPQTQIRYLSKNEIPDYLKNNPRIEHWDSILEFKVYRYLLRHYRKEDIARQQNIELLPKDKYFKAWTWNVDFVINIPSPIYVEAKGKWIINHPKLDSFWHTLKMCQLHKSEVFNNLILVGSEDRWFIPKTKVIVHPLKELKQCINNLTQK